MLNILGKVNFAEDFPFFEETRTGGSEAVFGRLLFIGSIRPKDWLGIVSPGIGVFDDEEKSVVQLHDF